MTRGRIKNADGTTRDIGEHQLELECPCGKSVVIFDDAVLHGVPMCADFNDRSPPDYLAWLRLRSSKSEAT